MWKWPRAFSIRLDCSKRDSAAPELSRSSIRVDVAMVSRNPTHTWSFKKRSSGSGNTNQYVGKDCITDSPLAARMRTSTAVNSSMTQPFEVFGDTRRVGLRLWKVRRFFPV